MAKEISSFGKKRDSSPGGARKIAPSPNHSGEDERISVKHVVIGNLVFAGVAVLLLAIYGVSSVLSGAAKPASPPVRVTIVAAKGVKEDAVRPPLARVLPDQQARTSRLAARPNRPDADPIHGRRIGPKTWFRWKVP